MLKYDDRAKLVGERIKREREGMNLKPKDFLPQIYKSEQSHKTLKEWEDGKRLPDLDSLSRMAELFNCDIGYLLGDYDERNRETADIKEVTGLSEIAIERLRRMWLSIKRDNAAGWSETFDMQELKVINTLLECDYSILINIHNYLFGQYDSFSLQYGETDDQEVFNKEVLLCNNNNSNNGIYIRANQMQSIFLLEIQKGLMELFGLIHRTPPKRKKRDKGGI